MSFRRLIALIESNSDELRNAKFSELASGQRGDPELAMLTVQHVNNGGVLNYVVEHVGDITHRMAQYPEHPSYYCGFELVKPKVERSHRMLTCQYGFAREHQENIRANAKYKGISVEEMQIRVTKALSQYADEHAKLKVWNEAQYLAREAAIMLGREKWKESADCLYKLSERLHDPEDWAEFAGAFDPNFQQ